MNRVVKRKGIALHLLKWVVCHLCEALSIGSLNPNREVDSSVNSKAIARFSPAPPMHVCAPLLLCHQEVPWSSMRCIGCVHLLTAELAFLLTIVFEKYEFARAEVVLMPQHRITRDIGLFTWNPYLAIIEALLTAFRFIHVESLFGNHWSVADCFHLPITKGNACSHCGVVHIKTTSRMVVSVCLFKWDAWLSGNRLNYLLLSLIHSIIRWLIHIPPSINVDFVVFKWLKS